MAMKPPPSIAWLVREIGEDATLRFIESAGGQRLRVPRDVSRARAMREYGDDVLEALVRRRGGINYQVPLVKSWRAHMLAKRGLSNNEIALRMGISWRQVPNLLRSDPTIDRTFKNPGNADQLGLFDLDDDY